MMENLDLDQFNLNSDDFLEQPRRQNNGGHPLVPKLDFTRIFSWREKQNEASSSDEEEEDEEVLSETRKILPAGSQIPTAVSETRR